MLEKRGVEAQTIPLLSKMIIASGRGSLLVTSGWADTLEKGKGVAFDELVGCRIPFPVGRQYYT